MTVSHHLLVVDDEPALRRLLERLLARAGFTCRGASDGAEARQALRTERFDLVLCDVTMPGESGLDLARHIRVAHPDTAVLMVTGLSSAEAANEALDAGAFGYVTKPFQPNDVLIQVANALQRRDAEMGARVLRAELESAVADRTAELEAATERLQVSEEMFRTLTDQSPLAILCADPDGNCVFCNERTTALSGRTPEELRGHGWLGIVHADDFERVAEEVDRAAQQVCEVDFEHRIAPGPAVPDGVEWVHTRVAPLRVDGRHIGFVALAEDITERTRHIAELEHLATHDRLTGLPNRALITDLVGASVVRARPGRQTVVMCVGIDRFGLVNETYGHHVGDELLHAVGRRLRGAVEPADHVGRLGGDTFVVVRDGALSEHEGEILARWIRDALVDPITIGGLSLVATARIGLAMTSEAIDAESLLRDADTALHRAKETGAAIEYYSDSMRERIALRLRLEAELRTAIDDGSIVAYYQPETDNQGRVVGAEALVRWRHPDLGVVSPADFIPLAEESGLIVPLGRKVLLDACRQAVAWRRTNPALHDFVVSVNISPRQFGEADFATFVTDALAISGLPPDALCLEVTESVALSEALDAPAVLARIRECGVKVAIDDFGTGYASLSYLATLPADLVKIDRSFVDRMVESATSAKIVEAILLLSHLLDLRVVAEGIETRQQWERLVELGCDLFQGYLLGRPVDAADFDPSGVFGAV